MIAKIIKVTSVLNSSEAEKLRSYSYNLPLFSTNLDYAYQQELSEYVLEIGQINHGYRYPIGLPYINEDDLKKINSYGDWVVSENLDNFEFLL